MPITNPDDLPRSRSGRVPKWVLDEANGRPPSELVPFRGASTTLTPPQSRNLRSGRNWKGPAVFLALVGVLAALVVFGERRPGSGINPLATSVSATPAPSRQGPPPGFEEQPDRLVPAVSAPAAPVGSFRFSSKQRGTEVPVTWSPCRPIHYVVRPDNAPTAGAELIHSAFRIAAEASGLVFVHDGRTDETPGEERDSYQPDRYGDRWAPVLVTWPTADEVPDLGVDIVGEAGAMPVRSPDGTATYVTGVLMLDPVKLGQMLSVQGIASARAVVLHEIGHLLGLAHVNDHNQVMAPKVGRSTDFQVGDRAGLAQVGSGPCRPDI